MRGPVHFNRLYGSSTFGHEGVGSWWNVLVKRAVDEPGWDRLPRRIAGHSADRAGREWPLSHGHEFGVGLRDIRAELRPEFVLLQVQVRVAIGQGHHGELVAERAAWKAIGEVARALTKVGCSSGDKDERDHVAHLGSSVADHGAAVRVPDTNDRAVNRLHQ